MGPQGGQARLVEKVPHVHPSTYKAVPWPQADKYTARHTRMSGRAHTPTQTHTHT